MDRQKTYQFRAARVLGVAQPSVGGFLGGGPIKQTRHLYRGQFEVLLLVILQQQVLIQVILQVRHYGRLAKPQLDTST